MRHFYRGRSKPRRKLGNSVIHVPSTMAQSLASGIGTALVIASPSIFAGGSASSNIEAQDKDRTVNVGHHVGTFNIDMGIRNTTADGIVEFCLLKVERAASTPALGTFPIPSSAEMTTQGVQQVCRMENPGKVFHFSKRAYSADNTVAHKIRVSPAKFKLSKFKAGDHWILMLFNRGTATFTFDFECRYKEYE